MDFVKNTTVFTLQKPTCKVENVLEAEDCEFIGLNYLVQQW